MNLGALESEKLRQAMDFRVYLPPCYAEHPDQRYPVLVLIHGQSYTDDQWDRLGADDTAEQLILSGEIAPFLIVMPRDRLWEQPKDDPFGEVLVNELIPLIDRSYRTIPHRSQRAIGGLSRGAGWAVHLGLLHWQLFGAIGAHSLAVFESDAPKIEQWLEQIPPEAYPRIFLDIGDRDRPPILQSAIWFEQLLTRKQIPHEWYLYSGYHQESYWQAHVEQYIRWYAAPWSEAKFDIIEP
jgi:enterochelin esterase-like enzyme